MGGQKILVALAGQPNSGKSTLFNRFTGASQYVANYPGVTVDKKVGWYSHSGNKIKLVDLPGTYSLTSYSPEEKVARDFIMRSKPSLVVNVIDASNLKRCLYLTFQLMEMRIPLVVNLNMIDLARKRGIEIDSEKLSERLGIPVVVTSIKSGYGEKALLNTISATTSATGGTKE